MPRPPLRAASHGVTDDLVRLHRDLLVIATAAIALLALGLALGWDVVTRGRAEWPQIYPYSVAGAGALVAAMALMRRGDGPRGRLARRIGVALAGATVLLGAGADLAVSAGLLPSSDPTTGSAGWSAALPSIAATATALSVVLIPSDSPRVARIRFWTAAGAGVVSLLVVLSYVYESSKLILGLGQTGTSLPMSLLGTVIVAASMSARPDLPPLRWLDTYYEHGVLRRVLPLLALTPFIPAAVHALVDTVEPDPAAADAIAQLVTVLILVTVIVVMGGGRSRAQRELAGQRRRVWLAFAHAPSGTAVVALDGRIVAANDALLRLTGRDTLEGSSAIDLVADVDQMRVAEALAEISAGRDGFRRDVRLRTGTSTPLWVDLNLAPVRDLSGRVQYLILQCADLTDRKDLERLLAEMAIRDPLTGLLNRDGLEQQISVLRRAARNGRDVVVVFVDVDGMKGINDREGHSSGDEVLREVARRLRSSTRSEDVLARIGGDEFVVVTTAPTTGASSADSVVARLRREINGPMALGARTLAVSVSLGASTLSRFADASTAIDEADQAMYVDKRLRRRSTDATLEQVGRGEPDGQGDA